MSAENTVDGVTIQIAPIRVEVEFYEPSTDEISIWNNNISEIFPIATISQKEEKVLVAIDNPFSGYMIETGMSGDVFDGKAVVRNTSNNIIAKFKYSNGKPTGKCKIYYSDGSLYFKGTLCEGYREGIGIEYDREGNVLFHGNYHKGKRGFPMTSRDDFMIEYNKAGNPTEAYKRNKKGQKHGICYKFVNGKIDRGEKWEHGIMMRVVKDFCGKRMTEFDPKGKVIYVGGYIDSLSEDYPRNGKGIGRYFFGKYEFEARWENGRSVKEFWIHSIPYVVLIVVTILAFWLLAVHVF